MPTKTTNYNLIKPSPDEFYDVAVPNANMDTIDGILKALQDAINSGATDQELAALRAELTSHVAEMASITKVGHTQLSNAVDSEDESKAATSKAVKSANDNANSRIPTSVINQPNGVLGLDEFGKAPPNLIPNAMEKIAEHDFSINPSTSITISDFDNYKEILVDYTRIKHDQSGSTQMDILVNGLEENGVYRGVVIGGSSVAQYGGSLLLRTNVYPDEESIGRVILTLNDCILYDAVNSAYKQNIEINYPTYHFGMINDKAEKNKIKSITFKRQTGQFVAGKIVVWGIPK